MQCFIGYFQVEMGEFGVTDCLESSISLTLCGKRWGNLNWLIYSTFY